MECMTGRMVNRYSHVNIFLCRRQMEKLFHNITNMEISPE